MKPHKHAELIKKWADGAEIQFRDSLGHEWMDVGDDSPEWNVYTDYRIKPEPKPDVTMLTFASPFIPKSDWINFGNNIRLTFDGETGELKAAEVLK